MSTVTAEKFTTGNKTLDIELSLLTEEELEEVALYAKQLRESRADEADDEDDDWADAPLTEEEEEALRQGREDFKNGNYLTLAQFKESQRC